jgi:hypothetical protein
MSYRELTPEEQRSIDNVNHIADEIENMVRYLGADTSVDGRWLAIAKTHFQEGFMAVRRSITKPDQF